MNGQQTITPERQMAAQQIGAVFNSVHEYLRTLEPKNEEGRSVMTQQLRCAHERTDEAAMWAIKSALSFGAPATAPPAAAMDSAAANETAPADPTPPPPAANETPPAPAETPPAPAESM